MTEESQNPSAPASDRYAQYWNNTGVEAGKAWWVDRPGGACDLRRYLDRSGLLTQMKVAMDSVTVAGIGADLAAGTCWASALLSRLPAVQCIHAIDYSEHRIRKLADQTIAAMDGDARKIVRRVGSFYETGLESASLDFCLLAQALHHADEPLRLLAEVQRIVKPGGALLIIGEGLVGPVWRTRRWIKFCLLHRRWPHSFEEMFPPDATTGDHYYSAEGYRRLFAEAGIQVHSPRREVFIATR